jgi:hypothetical protein
MGHTAVDEDWLDNSLRCLQTALFLNMASGSRAHSLDTEGVEAKLMPSRERGNVINLQLLWDNHPKQLNNVPICRVVPRYPSAKAIGHPALFIRGPLKGQFGVIEAVDGEQAIIQEIRTRKDRHKRIKSTKHPTYDLTLCQWPK